MTLDWAKVLYQKTGHSFAEYYVAYAQMHTQDFDALAEDLPNLQLCFELAIHQRQDSLIIRFWEYASDFLWFRGYWELYSMWGSRGLEAARRLNKRDKEAWLLSEMGWLQMEQGEFEIARGLFNQSRSIFERIGDTRGTCVLLRYLGVLAFRIKEIAQAENLFRKALQIAKENNYEGMIAETKNLQGSVARRQGDLETARQLYAEACKGYEATGDLIRLTGVLLNIGKLELEVGNLTSARLGFQQAMAVCHKVKRKDMLYGCHLGLAEVERQMGNHDSARQLARLARDGFGSLGMKRDVEAVDRFLKSIEK